MKQKDIHVGDTVFIKKSVKAHFQNIKPRQSFTIKRIIQFKNGLKHYYSDWQYGYVLANQLCKHPKDKD